MNDSLKNILSFIKEVLELRNKNIYTVSDYEMHIDLGAFYKKFRELVEVQNYISYSINKEETVFKLRYINEENKKPIPKIPNDLAKYIFLEDDNIELKDGSEELLKDELYDSYQEYCNMVKEVKVYNNLINTYNELYMSLYNIFKRIKDYEEKIEIIFGQKLLLWRDYQGNEIKRYILEASLNIDVDSVNNVITLDIDKNKFRGFVTDFFNLEEYKVKDIVTLNEFVREFNEEFIAEEKDYDIDECVKEYINYAALENEIAGFELSENQEIKINKTYIFENCGIIVRRKNVKLWIEDLEKTIQSCDDVNIVSPILKMFEIDSSDEEKISELINDTTYNDTKDEEVLFPLPSNAEQYKIVDKVKASNIVLVQGPPGTGKSHTIANLVSHYISEGKRVIVTSEKAKALEVLREKIPEKIRSLSLSLLTSAGIDNNLENSVNSIIKHQQDEQELEANENLIKKLYSELKDTQRKKQEVMQKIVEIMSKDTQAYRLQEVIDIGEFDELSLMDIAKWLQKNRQYKLIPLEDIENFKYSGVNDFFEKLDDIADEIKNNCYAISSFIPINNYLQNNEIELHIKERIKYKNYKLHNLELFNVVKQEAIKESVVDELENKIRELSCLYNFFDKEWIKSNIDYPVFINKVKEIYETLEYSYDFIMQAEAKTYDVLVEYENKSRVNGYLNIVKEILGLYDENKNMSLLNKIKLRSFVKSLDGMSCNKEKLTYENINYDILLNLNVILEYHVLIEKIRKSLLLVFSKDFFDIFKINANQFGKYVNDIKSILNAFLLFEKTTSEIDKLFAQMINTNLYPISYMQMTEDMVNNLFEDLKYFIVDNTSANKGLEYQKDLREYYQNYNLQGLNSVILAISTDDLEEFQKSKNLLLDEINVVNQYNNIKTLYQDLVRDKKELMTRYIYIMTSEEKRFLKANFEKVCVYHYVEKFYLYLEDKQKVLPDLYNEREFLIEKEKRIIAELVSAKGWYHQNLRMSHNISQSLSRWLNLRKKVGKGNSKNNNLYLKEMRKEMNIAKEAIPVWIMPIDKVIEQYPFSNEPPFDVLIMDESSQSSIFAITALARAKKVIVVGDDKQISPMNIFTSVDETNDLRKKYLRENVWNYQIAKDTSIYDIVQTICGNKKVMLTEHFRCLPEIINYSNKEFYNMEINPLKVRDKTNTIEKPIKTIYVPNAVCKKAGNQIINDAEIQRIVTLIGEIEKDSSYKNKTIGIIVLQNSNKYIQKLMLQIMRIFGEGFISERKIKIGTTYDFQGDERDVIILAMVISSVLENGERYSFRALTAKEYDRSFNVATSRAKEQMILVHSVNIEELNPNCNRYKLLNYCLNYDKEKRKEHEKMFESNFEKDVYEYLIAKNYNLIPQFKVGNYRLDFVLSNNNEQKIAIECDGDRYHGLNELESDLKRQGILERCGWKFVRIRASEFYYDKEESMKAVISAIENYLNNNDVISYPKQN